MPVDDDGDDSVDAHFYYLHHITSTECMCVSRYYVGIGLSCVLLLLVAFMYLGLCFGAFGETAGEDAGLCNRGTGACLLLMYVCCSHCVCLSLCLLFSLSLP